ncbi:MAG: peptide/nickel transport system ATP-binding protein ddpF [Pseudonocardiales bacterium]|nr:peptide/nickel transport system ATP-binding protein ddpF [Pseudonocardiales bacterium]
MADPTTSPATEPVATLRNLTVSLRRHGTSRPVLRGIDLEIAPGEILGLVGESGSGKSVLALTMMGLLPKDSRPEIAGEVRIAGTDMIHGSGAALRLVRREHLGVIFQDPMTSLNPTMRVGRQITEITHDTDEAVQLLTAAGVPDPVKRLRAFPHELSGGLRQRVMAAIALTGRPALIIADEPTTALDVTVQAQLLMMLSDLREEFGCSVLFITHDLAVAAQVTDRIAVLYQGRVAELGPTHAVLAHPSHPYTAGLLASRLALDTPRRGTLKTLPGDGGNLAERLKGCAYHTRCPLAIDKCVDEQPPLEPLPAPDRNHWRACWREVTDVAETVVPAARIEAHTDAVMTAAITSATQPVIEIRGLRCDLKTKSGGWGARHVVHALRAVDLDVHAGEALSIVGESGSGKSTLLRIIAGLTKSTGGSSILRGSAQMVFQDAGSSLTPWLTVGSLLRERLRPLRLGKAAAQTRIAETLELIGLPTDVLSSRPAELSGGQRQRICLARAVIVPPTVLLCDEPTSALDASLAASVLNLIRDMRREFEMAVVFVTHDLAVARLMGERIAVLFDGQIVEIGDPEQILKTPTHERTRALLDAVPRIADAVEYA